MIDVKIHSAGLELVEEVSSPVEILYSVDNDFLAASSISEITAFEFRWPSGRSSLLGRLDYLTSIFPFELLDIKTTNVAELQRKTWIARFKYDGASKDRARFEENFSKLLMPQPNELAV